MRGILHIIDLIVRGDADALTRQLARDPAAAGTTDHEGATPLHWAARLDRADLAAALLAAGAALEARDAVHDSTPLAWAAYYGSAAVTELLLRAGADPRASNRYGLTPAEIAEGGARGEHEHDAPGRAPGIFVVIAGHLRAARA